MDLSKVPDLELRQKIKPLNDQLDAVDARMNAEREKFSAVMMPLREQHEKLTEQLEEILDGREIVGTCDATGLPVFDADETVNRYTLACVA